MSRILLQQGKKFCQLYRDNWSCIGQRYIDILSLTWKFDQNKSVSSLPRGTTIVIEGNSYLAQLISAWICESSEGRIWERKFGFSYFAQYDSGQKVLLLANDNFFNHNMSRTIEIVQKLIGIPDIIILGNLNNALFLQSVKASPRNLNYTHFEKFVAKNLTLIKRIDTWSAQYPGASLIPLDIVGDLVPFCISVNGTCSGDGRGHTCMPGPILRSVEYLFDCIVGILKAEAHSRMRCTKSKLMPASGYFEYMQFAEAKGIFP